MSRVHDMGGRFGDGPVDATEYPAFKADWETRAHALTTAAMPLGGWTIDARRHGRECLPPATYMALSYYEKWLAGLTDMLVAGGVLTGEELQSGTPGAAPADMQARKLTPEAVAAAAGRRVPYTRDVDDPPAFAVGQSVVTRTRPFNVFVAGGHTRLPAYAAGLTGRVLRHHGAHVLPDAAAHGLGERPEHLYAVAFAAGDLWEAPEHPRDEVVVDLWQSYLRAP
ncbi:nitrile hydratase subunit beta [Pseudaestuariivita atlantica]|uniref:Nitrile hydratase subunit beta n=1 Tax=Pseudaestuariivita atlantica TaxID=1317121 RepID=A0A0L1JNA0_9RHOB|nr:nitrile hydratase subunit beta [Pseudaestuariivita atlantica]KNG92878.1 nitrile hydratase [Pseudaestuariivita atlantica]